MSATGSASISSFTPSRPRRRSRFALALALELQGDEDNALQYYESVAPGSDAEAAAKLRVGVIRCRRGEFAEALRVLNVCAEGGNDGDTLLFYRGTAFAMAGLCEDAIREWERLRDRHPENDRLKLNLARARYLLGGQRLAQNQYRPAIEQWERYLTDYPMDYNMAGNLAELHFREALAVFKSGAANANSQARECLQAAVKRDPRNRTYRFFLALCDVFSGEDASGGILSLRSLPRRTALPRISTTWGCVCCSAAKTTKRFNFSRKSVAFRMHTDIVDTRRGRWQTCSSGMRSTVRRLRFSR